jgi:hypothetical protein
MNKLKWGCGIDVQIIFLTRSNDFSRFGPDSLRRRLANVQINEEWDQFYKNKRLKPSEGLGSTKAGLWA